MSSERDLANRIGERATAARAFAVRLFLRKGPQKGVGSAMAPGGTPSLHPSLTEDDMINDSVWKLYSPEGVHDLEIIFFHGLQLGHFENAFWSTWLAKSDEEVIWPKEWLPEKFPNARILSVSYNSSATEDEGQNDMTQLGENLVQDIIRDTEWDIGQTCPVFLVGHCLGGTVIKQFIISALHKKNRLNPDKSKRDIERIETFLKNFSGAFFYSTPHAGSKEIDKLAEQLPKTSKILGLMKTLSSMTARINDDFRAQREIWNARTYGIAENLPTTSLGFRGVVVPEASVRQDVDDFYTHQSADHFTVCRAKNKKDPTVIGKLNGFITDTLPAGTIKRSEQAELVL